MPITIKIQPCSGEYFYGNCAVVAIAQAFNRPVDHVETLFQLGKIKKYYKGVTTLECKKIINTLGVLTKTNTRYVSFKNRKNLLRLVSSRKRGRYIYCLDNHLCLSKNGTLIDSYLVYDEVLLKRAKVIGVWEIKRK